LSPTRWLRIRELFDLALEQPTEERDSWVEAATAGDPVARREILSLLSALDHARETLERPAAQLIPSLPVDLHESSMVGRRVGAYDVTRLIGYGGMGAVYEGLRADGDFDKRVAIKFLRAGGESELALQRFRYERQILASLNHKNIAGLLDGGMTTDGQPYFVMEYVDGMPITTYCATHRLGVRERVALFRQVLAAVQHAHQQLVVHRDLKPGNILVTPDGTVKLLDFGIAKLMREAEGPDQLPMTRGGVRLFTPEYASPEQVRGLPLAPASDIFSSGVILYELLTGRRPIATEGKLLAEIEVAICTVPPTRPSTAVTPEFATDTAEGTVPRVKRRINGDLDAIVLTALAKEGSLRYTSAEQFLQDLRRWLEGHPVLARKAWLGYRIRKFIARRPIEVAATSLAVLALIGGIFATARQARIARLEAQKAAEVNQFMADMLSAADPESQGRDVTVRAVLDRAAAEVPSRQLVPEVEAQVRHTVAQTYYGLGLYDSARVHANRAFELRREVNGLRDERTLFSLSYVVAATEALGSFAQAESLARVAVGEWRALKGANPSELANALDALARMIEHQGRLDEAREAKVEAVAIRRTLTDSASRADLPFSLNNLSVSFMYAGKIAAAESLVREGLEVARRYHGHESVVHAEMLKSLASVQSDQGLHASADTLIRESTRIMEKLLGRRHPNYLRGMLNQAQILYLRGDMPGALAAADVVVPEIGSALPDADPTASSVLQSQGMTLDALGRYREGEVALRRSLDLRRKYMPPEHWAITSSESVIGYHFVLTGKYPEAERVLVQAYQGLVEKRGADASVTQRVAFRLSELYGRWGRRADSVSWAAKAK
jgi:serine/threonine-protein kinase